MACEIDEKYILNDRFNNYQLSFKRITINNGEEKTSLKALEGFEWMKNSFFVLSDNKPDETKYLTDDISIPKDNKIIVSNQRQDNKVMPLQEEYESHNIKYKLVLKQDKLYEICLYEHVLSSGAWSVDKGVLTLTDAFLKYDFHALVKDENTIISNYLPFEFRGRSLLVIP